MGRGRWNWPWLFTWPRSRKSSFRKTSEKPRQTVAGNVGVPEVSKITNYPPLQSPVQVPQVNFSEADMLPRMVLGWDLRSLSWELLLILSCLFYQHRHWWPYHSESSFRVCKPSQDWLSILLLIPCNMHEVRAMVWWSSRPCVWIFI